MNESNNSSRIVDVVFYILEERGSILLFRRESVCWTRKVTEIQFQTDLGTFQTPSETIPGTSLVFIPVAVAPSLFIMCAAAHSTDQSATRKK